MKLDKPDKLSPKPEAEGKSKPKTSSAKYEGNRFSSLILLILTVIISLVFYASGR